jgi:hypothetical protein
LVEQTILAIRDQPPEGLRRTPGRHPPSSITSHVIPCSNSLTRLAPLPRARFTRCSSAISD